MGAVSASSCALSSAGITAPAGEPPPAEGEDEEEADAREGDEEAEAASAGATLLVLLLGTRLCGACDGCSLRMTCLADRGVSFLSPSAAPSEPSTDSAEREEDSEVEEAVSCD